VRASLRHRIAFTDSTSNRQEVGLVAVGDIAIGHDDRAHGVVELIDARRPATGEAVAGATPQLRSGARPAVRSSALNRPRDRRLPDDETECAAINSCTGKPSTRVAVLSV
jgi:hypothetical protein